MIFEIMKKFEVVKTNIASIAVVLVITINVVTLIAFEVILSVEIITFVEVAITSENYCYTQFTYQIQVLVNLPRSASEYS